MVAALGALTTVTLGALATAGAQTGHGSLYVTTLPPGTSVWMDGDYLGETPLFVDDLDGGRHSITLTRSGWQPQSTAVDVIVGRVTTVSAVLATSDASPRPASHPKGTLSVRGANGAKVFVDGVPLPTPYESQPLDSGEHILLVLRGKQHQTSSIRIYPQTTTTVSLQPRSESQALTQSDEMLASLQDYVPPSDFSVSADQITIHYKGVEVECAVGSHSYVLNGKPGNLSVAPAMVGGKPYLPVSLLERITGGDKGK